MRFKQYFIVSLCFTAQLCFFASLLTDLGMVPFSNGYNGVFVFPWAIPSPLSIPLPKQTVLMIIML